MVTTPMITRIQAGKRMSQVVVHGNTAYLAGQVAVDIGADISVQTAQVLEKIDRLLAAAGTDKSRLLSVTVFLTDIRSFAEMNAVWDSWVPADASPARATIQARLANPAYCVEMQAIAALP